MSFMSEYLKLRNKKLKEEEEKIDNSFRNDKSDKADNDNSSFANEYLQRRGLSLWEEENLSSVQEAKKKEKEEEQKERTWFQAGAFEDGYQAGDITRTTLGTAADVVGNVGAGAVELVEGVADTIMYGVGGVGSLFGADEFADGVKDIIAKDIIPADKVSQGLSDIINPSVWYDAATGKDVQWGHTDKNSLLGEKSDSLSQSAGQLAAQIGLQAVGVPWWLTSGVSGFGSEVEQAFNEDATYAQAGISGAISAGAEILSEKISGGIKFGGRTLDEGLAQAIGKGISNKFVKTALKLGLDATGEGLEEVVSQDISAFGQWITYQSEEDLAEMLFSEEAMDAKLEAFIGGAVLGGVSSGVNTVKNVKKGADPVTGLTNNEQKVIDQVYEKRVTEKENQGEKLTNKDKNKLYDEIVEDMENGNIDISDIEEVLGGDSYKAYKGETDNSKKLKAEYDELANMEKGKMTHIQEKRLAELDKMDFNDTSKADGLKKTLSDEVFNTVRGDRKGQGSILMESYREDAKTRQAFKADYTQYKGTKYESAAKQTIDNAIKAKANDTRKVHNIVDMAAKLSSETGIVYEFGSNESVKEDFIKLQSEKIAKLEALENPTDAQLKTLSEMKDVLKKVQNGSVKVNGNITSKGVVLNLDSHKALNRVVGHELTHTLEKTAHYEKLQKALFDYAKTKGVKVDEKLKELEGLYAGVEGDAKGELTADLVGDYLFNDYDFVKRLSTDKNLFQKVWDEIKYLAKMATTGSKEARELAKVERMFQKAFQESQVAEKAKKQETDAASGDASFSLVYSKEIEEKSTNYYTKNKPEHISQEMYDAANETIQEMVDYMKPYLDITNNNGKRFLPEEIIGNTIFKNGSYGKTIENTTICYRTLAYIDFTNEVKKRIGRPLTVDESFLASQMLYDIASDPQCLYCYVSLDRKAYDGFLLEYTEQMNSVIEGYNSLEVKDKQSIDSLYKDFLNGRKDTKPMKARFNMWLDVAKSNSDVISLEDLTTEEVRAKIINEGGAKAKQITDAERYAQSASWAKKLEQYRSYNGEILKMSPEIVKKLNSHYGLRFYSFSEYTPAFIAENMQQIRDASLRGLYGLGYTKETDFATIFAPTGMNINMSVFGKMVNGEVVPDTRQGANWDAVKDLRNKHKNVGAVFVATNDALVDWALNQDWIDVVIPFHIVRTGASVAEFYKWTNNTKFQADKDGSGKNKTISPTEHHNDFETFKRLVEERGLTPRFDKWFDNPNYMKLVNETRLSVDESTKLVPVFNLDGAKESFDNFVGKGGYYGNWYKDGVDFDRAVDIVANDVLAGKKANDDTVDYGRQDLTDEQIAELKKRNKPRTHGHAIAPIVDSDIAPTQYSLSEVDNTYLDAVNRGDMETAQRMVDEAAKMAGYAYKGMHGTSANFNSFDYSYIGDDNKLGLGFYFTNNEKLQFKYDYEKTAYLKFNNPIFDNNPLLDDILRIEEELRESGLTQEETIKTIQKEFGYDGIVAQYNRKALVAFNPEQIKSADPVTYDDNGDVIPLSERFNAKNDDIRNSLSQTDDIAPIGRNDVFGKDFRVQDDIAPVTENSEVVNQTVNQDVDAPMENVDENVENVDNTEETVAEKISKKIENFKTELANNEKLREKANADFDAEISRLQAEYDSKKKKNTKAANDLLRRIERVQRMKSNVDADYDNRITSLQERIEKLGTPEYQRAEQRKSKQQAYTEEISEMIGDTSTWQDKKMGLSYQTNTLHRNLRDVVRDEKGNRDIAKADEIYEYLQGAYNHNEAKLKLESRDIKKPLADLNLNKHESQYAQMLGEFKYNPQTTLSADVVNEYLEKHKGKIDTKKVDKAIEYTRKTYDDLIVRVNEVLREQGMKEIEYRQGYFPHFTDEKQGFLAKLFNWKTQNNDIPTDIAGLTENFKPNRSWQSFNKQRKGDTTDYNLLQGFDTYVHGALDWIHHIEDIQKRRAFENELRYRHSEQGIKDKIDKIKQNTEYDADEAQELMDAVYAEARNPLNNFVTDLRNGTNNLAGKKSAEDRNMEYMTNRKIYSTMTNISNRVTANMVAGSVSSALTNFIPITQSWGQVSPISSLKATKDMIKNAIRSDGMIERSDFMTNRLRTEENLNQTGWDKAGKALGSMMEIADRISTEVVWRSKYLENLQNGMSENEAIHNADIFAENVMAGRSRGNMPTAFNAKNPVAKMFTAFQLEVANQYGYMFKDMPQDIGKKNIGKLVKGYAGVFVGAYVYNALYSALTGRDAAFSPLDILEDIFKDLGLGDEEEEELDVLGAVQGLAENVVQEVPFVGGLVGGGRVPISSALPYEFSTEGFNNLTTDLYGMLNEEDKEKYKNSFLKEMTKPLWYVGLPMGGGQIKKTTEGLSMFSEDIGPVTGSYTNSGNLRFPVEDTPWNRIQAGIFGQYASANAREYFDEDYAPLSPNQTQEYADVGMSFTDYHKYRDGLKGLNTLAEKFDYIDSLDLTVEQKNILINNIVDRDEPVDMTGYGNYGHYEEFDFAVKNPEKYSFFKENNISYEAYVESEESKEAYSWAYNNPGKYEVSKVIGDVITYRQYSKDLSNLQADKDKNGNSISGSRKKKVAAYINSLDADYGTKIILYKMQYESDDRYNKEIVEYLNGRDDISYMQMVVILNELGMKVDANGKVTWK